MAESVGEALDTHGVSSVISHISRSLDHTVSNMVSNIDGVQQSSSTRAAAEAAVREAAEAEQEAATLIKIREDLRMAQPSDQPMGSAGRPEVRPGGRARAGGEGGGEVRGWETVHDESFAVV